MQLRNDRSELSDAEFLQLIEAKSDSFYRVAYGYVRNPEDAKDIVQEAVCKAYAGKKRLREPDQVLPLVLSDSGPYGGILSAKARPRRGLGRGASGGPGASGGALE